MVNRSQYAEYPYPKNLIAALTDAIPHKYKGYDTTDWEISERGLVRMLDEKLSEREWDVLLMHWRDGKTYKEIGSKYGVTRERVRQVENKALHKLLLPSNLIGYAFIPVATYFNLQHSIERMQERMQELAELAFSFSNDFSATYAAYCSNLDTNNTSDNNSNEDKSDPPFNTNDLIKSQKIEYLGLSARPYNCIKRAGYKTIGDILQADKQDFYRIRNLGEKSANEVIGKIHSIGGLMSWEVGQE